MKKLYLLLILFAFQVSFAQNQSIGGLDFNFQNRKHEDRTSLRIKSGSKLLIKNKYTLSFELSICSPNEYGFIFNIFSNQNSIALLYIPEGDSASLQLVVDNKPVQNRFTKNKRFFTGGNWFHLDLIVDLKNRNSIFTLNKTQHVNTKIGEMPKNKTEIVFGSFVEFNERNNDIASFRLRNVKIYDDENELRHFWKLSESAGNIARDSKSDLDAEVLKPQWLALSHYQFKTVAKLGPFPGVEKDILPPVVYDTKNNRLVLIGNKFLYFYDLTKSTAEKEQYVLPLKQICYTAIYNENTNELYALYTGGGKVSVYDEKEKIWSDVDSSIFLKGHYHGSSLFINPLNSELYMIGGYGYYTNKNDLQKYDFKLKQWKKIPLKGDKLLPISHAALGRKNNNGDFFLFGGFSNESGKQIEKYRTLSDLYLLSMKDTSIKKIIETENSTGKNADYPVLHFDSLKNEMFLIGNLTLTSEVKATQILRYSLDSKTFNVVSDSFQTPYNFRPPIFYDKLNNKIITVRAKKEGKDSLFLYIQSLEYPLLTQADFNLLPKTSIHPNFLQKYKPLIVIAILLSAIIPLILHTRKKNKKSVSPAAISYSSNNELRKSNCIYLFGDFKVFDKNSNEITEEFSPKIKQLFVLLLMKSYNGSNHGITTEALTTYLWPDANSESTKNNRNVTISKLRKILSKLETIEIKYEHNSWNLSVSNGLFCDYIYFRSVLNDNGSILDATQKINEILSRGELLQGEAYDWFDGQKTQLTEESLSKLKKVVTSNKINPEIKIKIADSILLLDLVDEIGLAIKISSLTELGNHTLAKTTYDLFRKEYSRIYDEEYKKSFSDFLK
ncbi:MAG: Kelch repeat-containing protein [Ignavibacteria bacterium]|nr:MAG: Kelch repeat-containing protein [Ignavibacteria bacterium]KAF0161709.1 MAG: Kelch repeat-containing protein [Ignavibacteria bacterium]